MDEEFMGAAKDRKRLKLIFLKDVVPFSRQREDLFNTKARFFLQLLCSLPRGFHIMVFSLDLFHIFILVICKYSFLNFGHPVDSRTAKEFLVLLHLCFLALLSCAYLYTK